MKIGIILHPYGENKPAGLARTIFELAKALMEQNQEDEFIIYLKKEPSQKLELLAKHWQISALGGGIFWLEKLRNAPRADVYIFNTPVMPLFFQPKKSIIIALDFWYALHKPEDIIGYFTKWFTFVYHWISLRRADKIIAISRATCNDVVRLFGIPKEKVEVVYCGFKKICSQPEKKVNLPERFFFFNGIVKERKNVFNIVKAFLEFQKIIPDFHLVISGNDRGGYAEKIKTFIREKDLMNKVFWLGHLDDNELSYAYKRAFCLVFPTLLEGFGYPVLEAMDCGIPVITSNRSSLPEIAGEAALLVNPEDPQEIADAMRLIISDLVLRQSLIEKGHQQAQDFSWSKTASKTKVIINKLIYG